MAGDDDPDRVLVCGPMPPAGIEALEGAGIAVDHETDRGAGPLTDVIASYAGAIVRSAHIVDRATLEAAEALRVVGRAGVGVDNIDVEAATGRGVLVMNFPTGNTVTAAEHTCGLMLALARHIPQASRALAEGRWDRSSHLGVELKDKVLGVIGLGRIGREVARRALGFEMTVVAHDPAVSPEVAEDTGVALVDLPELLARADFVTLHVPLLEATRDLVDRQFLESMKAGAFLVNCSRGEVVDEEALLEALDRGRLAGAAADVFRREPTGNRALVSHERFVGTPHIGGATVEARRRVGEGIARQVADYLVSGRIQHAVNVQALPPEQQLVMLPYQELGRRLGCMLRECFPRVDSLAIEYAGDIAAYTLRPVTHQVLVGFLGSRVEGEVNVVNAAARAREAGLEVGESVVEESGGYANLLRVRGSGPDGVHAVSGTVFDAGEARIVEFDGLPIEVAPRGHLLVLVNEDRPGVVGEVGRFLGVRGINIADLRLGRSAPGERALAVVRLDEPLDDHGRRELEGYEAIRWVRQVSFPEEGPIS